MEHFKNLHFFQLSSQGNIYTMAILKLPKRPTKIIAASLKREIICFEYPFNETNTLCGSTKEDMFTYIPSGAEIISIDAFNRSETEVDVVIGITIIKTNHEGSKETFLNVYSKWDESSDFDLDGISQNCVNMELNFVPYHLYHTNLFHIYNGQIFRKEIVWLLSGSDEKIHLYMVDKNNHCYKESDVKEFFPEFSNPPSIVMWIDVKYFDKNTRRLSVFGCECGTVNLSEVNTETLEIISSKVFRFENTVSRVKIFSNTRTYCDIVDVPCQRKSKEYCLVVTNTVLPSVVFMNIVKNSLTDYVILEGSDDFNVTLCSAAADIDFDGNKEILLGNYGQKLLAYKYDKGEWRCIGEKDFADPIHALYYTDLTGDGVKELIVLTLRGVQILQHYPSHVQVQMERKIRMLEERVAKRAEL